MMMILRAFFLLGLGLNFAANAEDVWPAKNISHATFAKSVVERTPVEPIAEADNALRKIYFFTNIRNLAGERIIHRWVYQNRVMAEVGFDIGGPRWRVWSSKNLLPHWTGQWRVLVVNPRNHDILLEKTFVYKENEQ